MKKSPKYKVIGGLVCALAVGSYFGNRAIERNNRSPLEKEVMEHEAGNFNSEVGWSSESSFKDLLDDKYLVVKEGASDCPPCRAQHPVFKKLGGMFEEVSSYDPDLIGFFSADLGSIASVPNDGLTDFAKEGGIPAYSIWKNGKLIEGSKSHSVGDLVSLVLDNVPEIAETVSRDLSFEFDLSGNRVVAGYSQEDNSVLIEHRLSTNPGSVGYERLLGEEGAFSISFDLTKPGDMALLVNSHDSIEWDRNEFLNMYYSLLDGRAGVDNLWKDVARNYIRSTNPGELGLSFDIKDYGLGVNSFFDSLPEDLRNNLLESFPINLERVESVGNLIERVVVENGENVEELEISNLYDVVWNFLPPVSDEVNQESMGWTPELARKVRHLRPKVSELIQDAYLSSSSDEVRSFFERFNDGARAGFKYERLSSEQLRSSLSEMSSEISLDDRGSFNLARDKLIKKHEELENIINDGEANGIHLYDSFSDSNKFEEMLKSTPLTVVVPVYGSTSHRLLDAYENSMSFLVDEDGNEKYSGVNIAIYRTDSPLPRYFSRPGDVSFDGNESESRVFEQELNLSFVPFNRGVGGPIVYSENGGVIFAPSFGRGGWDEVKKTLMDNLGNLKEAENRK